MIGGPAMIVPMISLVVVLQLVSSSSLPPSAGEGGGQAMALKVQSSAFTEAAESLTNAILASGVIPPRAVRDAAHIAVATVNEIDYLLTWNCKHLANAQIARRISLVCERLGRRMPIICTPEELMGE